MKSGEISGSRFWMANKTQDGDYLISCAYLPAVLCVVFTNIHQIYKHVCELVVSVGEVGL